MAAAPPNEEAARTMLLALIAEEEERLDGIRSGHLEREEAEAQAALAFDDSAYGERLRRYEVSNDRTLLRIIETLRKLNADPDPADDRAFQPSNTDNHDNRIDQTSRPASALDLLAGADLALFALFFFARRSRALATPRSLGACSPSTMSTDAPASVSWVRSFKPASREPRRNSLRRKGNGPDRPRGRDPAIRIDATGMIPSTPRK